MRPVSVHSPEPRPELGGSGLLHGSVRVAAGHLALDHALHHHVLLDPSPELVRLRCVEVNVLLELEAELAAEHACVVEVATQEDLVHAAEVLLVQQVLVAEQLLIGLDLGRLQLDRGDDAVVWHVAGSLPMPRRYRGTRIDLRYSASPAIEHEGRCFR